MKSCKDLECLFPMSPFWKVTWVFNLLQQNGSEKKGGKGEGYKIVEIPRSSKEKSEVSEKSYLDD